MLNEDSDDHLLYRLAMMSLNGQGTEINKVKGQEYLEQAAESGNINAKYQLAKFKIETGDVKEIKDAILLLKEAADKGKIKWHNMSSGRYLRMEKISNRNGHENWYPLS